MTIKPIRVGVLLGDRSNPFWERIKVHFSARAEGFGFSLSFFQAEIEHDPEAQAAELDGMLDQDFAAIIVNPIQKGCLAPGMARAADFELPIFDVGTKTDWSLVKDLPNYVPTPTVNFHEQGLLGGRYIAEKLSGRRDWKAAIIEGRPDSAQSMGRSAGAAEALTAGGPDRLAHREPAYYDRAQAAELTRRILTGPSGVEAIFCVNDLMALGAADAAESLGRDDLVIVGVDLIPEAAAAIASGRITASVAFSPADVAEAVLSAVNRWLSGQPLQKGFPVPSRVVDIVNLDQYS